MKVKNYFIKNLKLKLKFQQHRKMTVKKMKNFHVEIRFVKKNAQHLANLATLTKSVVKIIVFAMKN